MESGIEVNFLILQHENRYGYSFGAGHKCIGH